MSSTPETPLPVTAARREQLDPPPAIRPLAERASQADEWGGEWDDEDEAAEIAAFEQAGTRRYKSLHGTYPSDQFLEDLDPLDAPASVPGSGVEADALGWLAGLGRPDAHPQAHKRHSFQDEDRPEDLPPCVAPPGYQRDRSGRWRYCDGGDLVPGARDRTMGRSWRFPSRDGAVLVPELYAGRGVGPGPVPELAWCPLVARGSTPVPVPAAVEHPGHHRTHVMAWVVPADEWRRRADLPLGLDAPELGLDVLVDVAGAAALAGVSPATVRSYAHRGYLPPPIRVLGGSPLWSRPVILRALARRPGQGRPARERGASTSARRALAR